jgi:hypothetical protein
MLARILLGLLLVFPFVLQSDTAVTPLNVKLGLWQTTVTTNMAGLPAIPDSALAQLPPDQRAKIEAAMKQVSGQPMTTKSCMTKDKLEKSEGFRNAPKSCTYTVVSSTSSKLEMKLECAQNGMKMTGNVHVEAVDSGNVKGSMQMNTSGNGSANTMNMNSTFTSKWLGAPCGDVQ